MEELTIYRKIIPEKPASYAAFPVSLDDSIKEYLKSQGISKLYTHQAQM